MPTKASCSYKQFASLRWWCPDCILHSELQSLAQSGQSLLFQDVPILAGTKQSIVRTYINKYEGMLEN